MFHEGERIFQHLTGESWIAEQNAKMIGNRFSNGVMHFLKAQQFAVMSYKDREGGVRVTFLYGGASRLVRFEIHTIVQLNNHTDLQWGQKELSPFNPVLQR